MRRLSISNKKVRGIPRRLRSLRRWAAALGEHFPVGLKSSDRYCNFKIPVLSSLVEGAKAKRDVQSACAQELINACESLIRSRPQSFVWSRVVAVISLPDMFASEVCIYADPEYYKGHTEPHKEEKESATLITNRSLANEWGLILPLGFRELGLAIEYNDPNDPEDRYSSHHWFFGEIDLNSATKGG